MPGVGIFQGKSGSGLYGLRGVIWLPVGAKSFERTGYLIVVFEAVGPNLIWRTIRKVARSAVNYGRHCNSSAVC
jgi:hypothetical protein